MIDKRIFLRKLTAVFKELLFYSLVIIICWIVFHILWSKGVFSRKVCFLGTGIWFDSYESSVIASIRSTHSLDTSNDYYYLDVNDLSLIDIKYHSDFASHKKVYIPDSEEIDKDELFKSYIISDHPVVSYLISLGISDIYPELDELAELNFRRGVHLVRNLYIENIFKTYNISQSELFGFAAQLLETDVNEIYCKIEDKDIITSSIKFDVIINSNNEFDLIFLYTQKRRNGYEIVVNLYDFENKEIANKIIVPWIDSGLPKVIGQGDNIILIYSSISIINIRENTIKTINLNDNPWPLCISNDGNMLAWINKVEGVNKAIIYDIKKDTIMSEIPIDSYAGGIRSLAIAPNSSLLAIGYQRTEKKDPMLMVFNYETKEKMHSVKITKYLDKLSLKSLEEFRPGFSKFLLLAVVLIAYLWIRKYSNNL